MRSAFNKWLLATLLSGSGSAFALIDSGTYGTPGELFLSVYDPASSRSYYRDLGVNLADFLTNPALSVDLASDAGFADFKGVSGLVYNIAATYPLLEDFSNLESWGYLATSSGGESIFDSGFNALDGSKQILSSYIGALNPEPFTGNAREIAENLSGVFQSGEAGYFDEGTWGESMGGLVGGNTTGKPGEPLPFFHINNQTGEETGIVTRLGFWLLGTDGKLSFAAGSGNLPPVAQAGEDRVVGQGSTVSLSGFASNDPDNGPGTLTFRWKQIDGASVTLSGADTASASFRADSPGVFTFRLTVSDGAAPGEDEVRITVSDASTNQPPLARAGADRAVLAGSVVTLDAGASQDADQGPLPLTYAWSQVSGAPVDLSDPTAATPLFTAVKPGVYVFQLTVNDGVASSVDAVTIQVDDAANNQAPLADAGANQQGVLSLPLSLDASASRDPDNRPAALTYAWRQVRGATAMLEDATSATPRFVPAREGIYQFELTVSDGLAIARDMVTVNVVRSAPNTLPVASAGADQTVLLGLGNQARLDGTASYDPDAAPNALSYLWEQVAGPTVTLKAVTNATPALRLPKPGVYTFRLTVSDGTDQASDTVTLYAETGRTQVPALAAAGADQSAAIGKPLVLDGSASGGSGPIAYRWRQTGGPVTVAIGNFDNKLAAVSLPRPGRYQFELRASNAAGQSVDTVEFTAAATGAGVTLDAPVLWQAGQARSFVWQLRDIKPNTEARILFSREGRPFDLIARVSAGAGQWLWQPAPSQVTEQGVLRICLKPSARKPQVCDSVGVIVSTSVLTVKP